MYELAHVTCVGRQDLRVKWCGSMEPGCEAANWVARRGTIDRQLTQISPPHVFLVGGHLDVAGVWRRAGWDAMAVELVMSEARLLTYR